MRRSLKSRALFPPVCLHCCLSLISNENALGLTSDRSLPTAAYSLPQGTTTASHQTKFSPGQGFRSGQPRVECSHLCQCARNSLVGRGQRRVGCCRDNL